MASIFSKFKPTPGMPAIRKNLPTRVIPVKKYTVEPVSPAKKLWMPGLSLGIFLLILLAALAITVHETRQQTAQLEIIARIQMHVLHLSKAAQQVRLGDITAFEQIKDSHRQLDQYILLLSQGGSYRNHTVTPISNTTFPLDFETYRKNWLFEEEKINRALNQKDKFVNFSLKLSEISTISRQIQRLSDELITRMTEMSRPAREIALIARLKPSLHSATKTINAILPGDTSAVEIVALIAQDRRQLSAISQELSTIHQEQRLFIRNESDLDIPSQIHSLLSKLDELSGTIQAELPTISTAKLIIQEIVKKNDMMMASAREFDDAFETQDAQFIPLLELIILISGTGTAIALFLFIRALYRSTHNQLVASKHEIDKTQKAILQLLTDMKKMADGDLTVRTAVTGDITGAIADSINYTIEELHSLVEQVNAASAQVVEASNQAQHVSSELLTAAQQQSVRIEETTIAVLGMTESISEISDAAAESARVARQSLATAEKGTKAVRESIAGMNEIRTHIQDTSKRIKRLGESSQEIGEIVALISDITEQTNVLALNAALQATAAGEAGRGFTVIAQEVQRLSERSAEASKQIGGLIKTIQGDMQDTIAAMERSTLGVAKGAKRSDAAGQALEEIEDVSKQLAQLVTSIFDTTHAQTQAANQVVANMEEILHITRQTTVGTMQTTVSIKQISGFASELKASVSSFKV